MSASTRLSGRLVLDDGVILGHIDIEDGHIAEVTADQSVESGSTLVPGYVDIHVHGWGGYDAMAGPAALTGMSRALAERGVTSFLPTAVTASLDELAAFAETVRTWMPGAPGDGAEPLGFNLEGPFLAPGRRGAHREELLREPADVSEAELEPLLDGLEVITIAPELPGALELIKRLAGSDVRVSLGHSDVDAAGARDGYAAGAVSTTHLFNAMSGVAHRDPGLAVEALLDDDVWVELIADGYHVDPRLWTLLWRLKPEGKALLVSDAIAIGDSGRTRGTIGGLECEVQGDRVTLAGTSTLAGSVTALDREVRNVVEAGITLHDAASAAGANPSALLGRTDRGRLEAGRRADIVELDADLQVRRVMRSGEWIVPR